MTTEAMAPPSTKSQVLSSYDVTDFPALNGMEEVWRFTPLKRLRELVTATSTTGGGRRRGGADLPEGVTVGRSTRPAQPLLTPFDRISALAHGAAADVTLIEVGDEVEPGKPVQVRIIGQGTDAPSYARTYVKVGRFAKATLVLEQVGSVDAGRQHRGLGGRRCPAHPGHARDWDNDAVQAQHVRLRVGRDAKVRARPGRSRR